MIVAQPETTDAPALGSAIDVLTEAGQYTKLLAYIEQAGLTEELATREVTILAPTDDAFTAVETGAAAGLLQDAPTIEAAMIDWEQRERPLTEHTQLWTRIYGATMCLPKPMKKVSILIEKLPWVAAQYVRAAHHVPTGCEAGPLAAI